MKLFRTFLKIVGLFLLAALIGVPLNLYFSGPELPDNTDEIIESALLEPIPKATMGLTGFAVSQNLKIWYDNQKHIDSTRGTVLLIMGHSNDAMSWSQEFMDVFLKEGYQVIRYDHRGTGLSDWIEDWNRENPYTLGDMVSDGLAILDTLKVQKAHLIGISMGGMIAQEMAFHHPERTASLTSMMSTGDITDPNIPPISSAIPIELIKTGLKYGIVGGDKNNIKMQLASKEILMGEATYDTDIKGIAQKALYSMRLRKGYNFMVGEQHQEAIVASHSRHTELGQLKIPSLVIHGEKDPLIPIAHGKKCAEVIPNSRGLWLPEMGHDIPNVYMDTITKAILSNFNRTIN